MEEGDLESQIIFTPEEERQMAIAVETQRRIKNAKNMDSDSLFFPPSWCNILVTIITLVILFLWVKK